MVSKQKTIHNFNLRFFCILLAIVMLSLIGLSYTGITVYADTGTSVEAEHSDGSYTSSGGKWYATYSRSGGYKGQGVLLYLLERDGGGAVAGTTPKAFPCSGSMLGYELHAQDKYNRYPEVTHWETEYIQWAAAPGMTKNGGFMKNSTSSNVAAIKAWLKTPTSTVGGSVSTKGIDMVEAIWGSDIATRFTNEEIILVAEPIVAVQFSEYYEIPGLTFRDGASVGEAFMTLIDFRAKVVGLPDDTDTEVSTDLRRKLDESTNQMQNLLTGHFGDATLRILKDSIISSLGHIAMSVNGYYPLGEVYAGTPKMVASYYAGLALDNSVFVPSSSTLRKAESGRKYYRLSANAATYIPSTSTICSNAGFDLWPTGSNVRIYHPDGNLNSKSIGMLAMLAFTEDGEGDYTHTYDTSCGSTPGKAPEYASSVTSTDPSLQRSYTIIKAYRTLNTSTSSTSIYINDGVYTREDTIGKILIEDEPTYTVVDWFTTSTPTATVGLSDATRWNESKSHASIMEQGNSSLASPITLPSAQKYLYVLLECTHPSSPPTDANYTLLE